MKTCTSFGLAVLQLLLALASPHATADDRSKTPASPEKATMVYLPDLRYPAEVKRLGIGGSGLAELHVNSATGIVTAVRILKSTGNRVLDREIVRAFSRTRFRPGGSDRIKVPVTFDPKL